jgi:hypothetical protein
MASTLSPEKSKRLVKFPFPFQGLNSTVPSLVVAKTYSPLARNIRFARGEISSSPASASAGNFTLTVPIVGAFTSHRPDGTIISVGASAGLFGTYDSSTGIWSVYPIQIDGARGTDEDRFSFADVFGEIFASNGVGLLAWTDGGGVWLNVANGLNVATNSSPFAYSGRFLESFAGRLVLANTREGPVQHEDRVRWSVAQSPRDFTSDSSAGANDIVDLSGPITGAKAMGGRYFVHKRSGITAMLETGLRTPSFSFQTVVDGIGTIAGATLLNIRGVQFFLGSDDVFMYDGASAPQPIGEAIRKELFANINWAKVGNCFAIDYPDLHEYHLFIPEGSNQWAVSEYVYNYFDRTWAKNDVAVGAGAGALLQVAPPGDSWDGGDDSPADDNWDTGLDIPWDAPAEVAKLVPFWGRSDGTVRIFDETATSLGLTATVTTSDYDLDSPGTLKTVDRVRVTVRQRNDATLSLSLSVDGGATFTTPTTAAPGAPVGDETSLKTLLFPVTRTTGEFFRLKLTATSRFSLVSWEFEVIDRAEVR